MCTRTKRPLSLSRRKINTFLQIRHYCIATDFFLSIIFFIGRMSRSIEQDRSTGLGA